MSEEIKFLEAKLKAIKNSTYNQNFPEHIISLNIDMPVEFQTFTSLKEQISLGKVLLKKNGYEINFKLIPLFSKINIIKSYFFFTMFFLTPLISFIFSFYYSPWWILGVFFFPIFFIRQFRKVYDSFLFFASTNSEIAFCYLFFNNEIYLHSKDYSKSYYFK